jgi:hypothetical protein
MSSRDILTSLGGIAVKGYICMALKHGDYHEKPRCKDGYGALGFGGCFLAKNLSVG